MLSQIFELSSLSWHARGFHSYDFPEGRVGLDDLRWLKKWEAIL